MQRLLTVTFLLVGACSKNDSKSSGEAAPSNPLASVVAAQPAASAAAATAPNAAQAAWYVGSWRGEFGVTRRASATTTKEGGPNAWDKDNGQKFAGPAKAEVTIDANGDAVGTITGALGELGLRGKIDGEQIRANLVSKSDDPTAIQNGYFVLKHDAELLKGQLSTASGDALAMRQANVELKKVSP